MVWKNENLVFEYGYLARYSMKKNFEALKYIFKR